MVADPGGLSLLEKIKLVSPSKKYSPKNFKKRSIFYHPTNSLHDRVTNHGPRGPKKKLVYPRDKYTPKKVQKTEYIKLVIPVTYQDGPFHRVHHQGRGTLQD